MLSRNYRDDLGPTERSMRVRERKKGNIHFAVKEVVSKILINKKRKWKKYEHA